MSSEQLSMLMKEHNDVVVVMPPPYILLNDNISDDIQRQVNSVKDLLDDCYKIYRKFRNQLQLIPLSAFCSNSVADLKEFPYVEPLIDEGLVSTNIDSVISHSLAHQNTHIVKAYKKLQSCCIVISEDNLLNPNLESLKTSLVQQKLNDKALENEKTKILEQSLFLLEAVEEKAHELEKEAAQNIAQAKQNKSLSEQNKTLVNSLSQADKKLRYLEKSLSEEVSTLSSQLAIVQKDLQQSLDTHSDFVQKSKKEFTTLEKTKNREIKSLESSLEEKTNLEYVLKAELAELRAIKASKLWKVSSKVEKLSNVVDKHGANRKKLAQDMSLLYTSELFDAGWYLETYKDVKKEGIDPAEHYLLYGAKEGRKPSQQFDGNWYLQANPDVAEQGFNPLLHYIKFGREEKRPISPVMITFNKK
ncbi:coiled-coil domain-containing protein [Alteromonas stellipolaris]|uniref:Uncharacterized protein n=1 Tax=Alteromonas stellipolaris TaxID=233316 RepID=A0AAW7Z5V8_9ALTE|nr:hypothetical protein [Alteromonas stellipolaris]MDO6578814.1 hypothetical protein [Alteromonas stellipolaris]MDP2536444.1 hypothetical protein [Alteromonas stellipolaris]